MKRQSRAALAKRKLVKASSMDLDQHIDMAAESSGYELPSSWQVPREVEKIADKFESEVERALQQWVKKNPLKEGDVDDMMNEVGLVLLTLQGHGAGIWDGGWDHFFNNPKKEIPQLQKFLKQKVGKYADDTGGGLLNEAFMDAAYELSGGGDDMDASALSASVMRDICATLLKGGKKTLAQRFVREVRKPKRAKSSFKAAVPGNLGNNTKPSTQQSQKQAVDLLKQGGILPPEEKAADYPVLTAQVKKQIIAVLLKRKQPKLATWASRNLVAAKAKRVRAAKNYAEVVFLQRDYDFKDFNGSGGRGQQGFFDSDEEEMFEYLKQWDYGDNYGEIIDPKQSMGRDDSLFKKGAYIMTYNPGLGHAGLAVKAPIGARTRKTAGSKKKSSPPVKRASAAAPMMFLDEEDWDDFEQANPQEAKKWKGYYFKMTFGVVTEESAEQGDYAETGWEVKKSAPSKSLEELLTGESDINGKSWLEWSSSHPQAGDWITSQEEQDFRTGETTTYDLFIERADRKPLSKEEMQYISRSLGVRM